LEDGFVKKLFSVLFVVFFFLGSFALVGCNGLWGFDDDDDVVAPSGILFNINGNVDIPGDGTGESLRAAVTLADNLKAVAYRMKADGTEEAVDGVEHAVDSTTGAYSVSFRSNPGYYFVRIISKTKATFKMLVVLGNLDAANASQPNVAVTARTTAVGILVVELAQKPVDLSTLDAADVDTLETKLKATDALDDVASTTQNVSYPVATVTLNVNTLALSVGGSETLTANVAPVYATNKTITWTTSDATVATVDNTGKVTAVKVGTAKIKAAAGGKEAECTVTVSAVAVSSVTLSKTSTSLVVGANETLTATVLPANASEKTVTWTTSDATVATVDNTGKVTAVKVGTAKIKAAAGGKEAECTVTVTAAPVAVTGVTLNKSTTSLAVGANETLTATVLPTEATNKTVTWTTSDATVATVDSTGKVIAVKVGTAKITATAGGKSAECSVTVTAATVAVTSVTLKTSTSLTVGANETLTATVLPANATNKTVTWTTSDETVATVDATGKVTALKAGTAKITATAGGKSAECSVTVTAATVAVTSVTLKTSTSLTVGANETLTATVLPTEATNKTVTWTTSDATVATVDSTGKVTAVKAGTAKITATAGGKSAECSVTVTAGSQGAATITVDPAITDAAVSMSITIEGVASNFVATVTAGISVNSAPITYSLNKSLTATVQKNIPNAVVLTFPLATNADYIGKTLDSISSVTFSESLASGVKVNFTRGSGKPKITVTVP
jgi:uncharacterized protein YjdB